MTAIMKTFISSPIHFTNLHCCKYEMTPRKYHHFPIVLVSLLGLEQKT